MPVSPAFYYGSREKARRGRWMAPRGPAFTSGFATDGSLWLSGHARNAGSSRRPRPRSGRPPWAIAQDSPAEAPSGTRRTPNPLSRGPTPRATALNPARSPCPAAEAELSPVLAARQYPPKPGRGRNTLLPCALCRLIDPLWSMELEGPEADGIGLQGISR